MPCDKKFGKVLRKVKKQYPKYSKKRQMTIAWGIIYKHKYRKQR